MPKKINFTQPEKTWLLHLLDNRIFQLLNSTMSAEKILRPFKSSRSKLIAAKEIVELSGFETALCSGCINEPMEGFYREIQVKNAYDVLTMTAEQNYLAGMIDMGKDMLYKLGYARNTRFPEYNYEARYRNTLKAIEKLKHAKDVCISRSGDHVYKIGFLTSENEVFVWETSYDLGVYDVCIALKSAEQIEVIKKSFSLVTGRMVASSLLHADVETTDSSAQFFKAILN